MDASDIRTVVMRKVGKKSGIITIPMDIIQDRKLKHDDKIIIVFLGKKGDEETEDK